MKFKRLERYAVSVCMPFSGLETASNLNRPTGEGSLHVSEHYRMRTLPGSGIA